MCICFPADRISVELLPPEKLDSGAQPKTGILVARLRIHLRTDTTGSIAGKVLITLDGTEREPDVLPVTARVVGKVEVVPSTLVLPLNTGSGQAVNSGVCSCSAGWKSFTLAIEDCPIGLSAVVAEDSEPTHQRVTIELKPGYVASGRTETRNVRMRAVIGDETVNFVIPILCRDLAP